MKATHHLSCVADWLKQLLLFNGWLFGTETSVSTSSEFGLEFFDTASGINELKLACIKRVTNIANVDAQLFSNAASLKGISAAAGYFGFAVIGVDAVFHDFLIRSLVLIRSSVFSAFTCVERRNVDWKLK